MHSQGGYIKSFEREIFVHVNSGSYSKRGVRFIFAKSLEIQCVLSVAVVKSVILSFYLKIHTIWRENKQTQMAFDASNRT